MKKNITILFIVSILISLTIIMIDVIWNIANINFWWLTLSLLPLIFIPFYKGFKSLIFILIFSVISVGIWFYTEYLIGKIDNIVVSHSSLKGRIYLFFMSFFIGVFFKRFILNSLKTFLLNVRNIFFIPRILKAFIHLLISYIAISFLFSIVYASFFVFSDNAMFLQNDPSFIDFILYSLFIPTTFSYDGLTPNNYLINILTLLQLFIGLFITVVYVGVIVGLINKKINNNPNIFN